MINKSWNELNQRCPIEIGRIINYAKEFESNIPNKITIENLNKSKEGVLNARANFDSMVVTLTQVLHDKEILKNSRDKILFAWLVDNFGRYMKRLDDEEFNLVVKYDEPGKESGVGVSRISAYSKLLITSCDSIIYESLLKATEEYLNFKDTKKLKREPRMFLYILFQILQVTLAVLGGLTREKTGTLKKGAVQTFPVSSESLMGETGQKLIKKEYEKQTGINLDEVEKDLKSFDIEPIEGEIPSDEDEDEEGEELEEVND